MSSIETVTILITDLVSSTQLAARVGPAAADELRHEHFGVLRAAIDETGGTEVKNTGDGLMVAFRSSSAAVDCGIAMQQRVARRNRTSGEPLHVRIGVGMGDATVEDGDYFGMPSVEAARLCDKAGADRILVSELVSMMARRDDDVFAPVGQMSLKGIPDPVRVFEVRWNELDSAGSLPLPAALTVASRLGFAGRAGELAIVQSAWHAAMSGAGGVVLISGEPGSGKTRLLTEAARIAHKEGATVLFGRCQEELGTPYKPLLQAVGHYAAASPSSRLARLREQTAILTRLAPELESLLPQPVARAEAERRSEQRLFADAIGALLASAVRHAPVVLALDDLHLARPPLLTVIRQLVKGAESEPVLLVLAYRDTEIGTDDPLSDLVVELRRDSRTVRVRLGGMSDGDVAELVRQAWSASRADDAELVRELGRFAGGSARLIAELLTHVSPSDTALDRILGCTQPWDAGAASLPDSVIAAVHARFNRLSEAARHVLEVAAVVGDEFEAALVADVATFTEGDCLAALDEGLAAGLLREQIGSIRRFAFASPIVRHASYAVLTAPQRVRLHRAVAERLETSDRDRISEIAEHWFAATALAGSGAQHLAKAIGYAEQAGRDAGEHGAFAQAGRHYRHAAQLVEASEASSRRRCELLLQAGEAHAKGDQVSDAKEAFGRAAEMARRVGDPMLLVAAALGYGMGAGDARYAAGVDERLVGLLEQALAGLEGDHGPLRVRLLSRLAVELHLTGFVERREALSRQAVELAESIADPESELIALYGWLTANWSPDDLSGRLAGGDEVMRRANELGDLEMAYRGHDMKLRALLELGDMAAVDIELAALERIADTIGKPLFGWHARSCRVMRALHAGDARDAERWSQEALELGSHADRTLARRSAQAQVALRHWLVGRPRELIPLLREAAQSCPWLAVRRARLAFGLADQGRKTEAIAEFERLAQDDFGAVPHDGNWLLTMGFLAFACNALGDLDRARLLTAALEPYGERFLVSGDGTTTWGPVRTSLAVLAVTLGAFADAGDQFERALERCAATGSDAHGAFARREYARMLIARGHAGDRDRARGLLHEASATCARRGFAGLAEQVASLQASVG